MISTRTCGKRLYFIGRAFAEHFAEQSYAVGSESSVLAPSTPKLAAWLCICVRFFAGATSTAGLDFCCVQQSGSRTTRRNCTTTARGLCVPLLEVHRNSHDGKELQQGQGEKERGTHEAHPKVSCFILNGILSRRLSSFIFVQRYLSLSLGPRTVSWQVQLQTWESHSWDDVS